MYFGIKKKFEPVKTAKLNFIMPENIFLPAYESAEPRFRQHVRCGEYYLKSYQQSFDHVSASVSLLV